VVIKSFKLLGLDEAVDRREELRATGGPDVRRFEDYAHSDVTLPPIAYGGTDGVSDESVVRIVRSAHPSPVGRNPAFIVANAMVRFRYGFVTAGNVLFRDSLWHAPFHAIDGARVHDDGTVDLPDHEPDRTLSTATRLMSCHVDSYYHWLMDVLAQYNPAAQTVPDERRADQPLTVLVPALDQPFKRETMELLGVTARPHVEIAGDAAVAVEQLVMKPAVPMPHPRQMPNFDAIRSAALAGSSQSTPARVYISRFDASNRRMENEAAVIEVMRTFGFAVVLLSGRSVADQVRLFAGATHIVAPHGAGLSNLLFCRAGTRVLELVMDGYLQWSFRHICAVRRLTYGCVFGRITPPRSNWIHDNNWTLPLDGLWTALRDPAFGAVN